MKQHFEALYSVITFDENLEQEVGTKVDPIDPVPNISKAGLFFSAFIIFNPMPVYVVLSFNVKFLQNKSYLIMNVKRRDGFSG